MSNSNGRIYIDSPYGVSISDVQQVLGRGTGDLGLLCSDQELYLDHIDPVTQKAVYLPRRVNIIKPWAKYKPIHLATLALTGKSSLSEYWKAADGKCGFVFAVATEFGSPDSVTESFAKSLYNGQLDWTYAPPVGGISVSPFRIRDFDGYDHNAECPIGDLAETTVYLQLLDNVYHLLIDYDYNDPGLNDWLTLANLSADNFETNLSSWYLGVLLYNGTTWMAVTSTNPLGSNGGYSVDAEFAAAYAGQWQIVPFISKNTIAITSQGVADGKYISFYNKHRETITIVVGSVTIIAEAAWTGTRSISWEVTVINNDGSTKSFTNPSVIVRRTDSPISAESGNATQIGSMNLSDFTVQGGATTVLSSSTLGAITPNEDADQEKYYWVRFTCDQQGYNSQWNQFDYDLPMEEL